MSVEKVTSLRQYKAHKQYRRFIALPCTLRTPERAEGVLSAIFDYAYEHVATPISKRSHDSSWEDTRQVSKKLVEFMPASVDSNADEMMQWLHENMVSEAWTSPDYLKDFIHECLRHG